MIELFEQRASDEEEALDKIVVNTKRKHFHFNPEKGDERAT